MAEVKDYFTDAGTLDRQEFGNLFASSIHLHDDTACGRATLLQCLDTRYWPSPMVASTTLHCPRGIPWERDLAWRPHLKLGRTIHQTSSIPKE